MIENTGPINYSVSLGVNEKKLVVQVQIEGVEFEDAEAFSLLEEKAKLELLKIINKMIKDAIKDPQYIEYEEHTVAE